MRYDPRFGPKPQTQPDHGSTDAAKPHWGVRVCEILLIAALLEIAMECAFMVSYKTFLPERVLVTFPIQAGVTYWLYRSMKARPTTPKAVLGAVLLVALGCAVGYSLYAIGAAR